MIVAFAEQNYDVMYECNEQLLQFCQVSALSLSLSLGHITRIICITIFRIN